MSTALSALLIFIGVGIDVWLFSFIMEAIRPVPKAPRKLRWAPDIPVEYVEVGGNTLRFAWVAQDLRPRSPYVFARRPGKRS